MTAAGIPASFAEAFGEWTPRAVVFDCDGLLLDTESVWQRTEDRVVAAHGAQLREGDAAVLHGATIEIAAELIARRSGHDEQEILADLHRVFDAELGTGMRTMPGAAEILSLAGERVPLGCASNSWLESLEDKLTRGGMREHFTVLEASDTVARPKPAPDMYAAAARALGAEPSEVLAFEDSGTGAQSAREAGLRLIAVPTAGFTAPPADLALSSLTDPELADWITTW
ncbi:MAG: HAD family phosphatase [Actinomycetales bacterium]|nr:HAD family phosphatase [Actinomycetales bacterium]